VNRNKDGFARGAGGSRERQGNWGKNSGRDRLSRGRQMGEGVDLKGEVVSKNGRGGTGRGEKEMVTGK